ncbi:MAG TPA: hypothetical protein VMW01_00510 [Williamwhitmania sp.]|nr:hypothetical protein [Williamwhitmania sp.]
MEKESNIANNQGLAIFNGSEEDIIKNLESLREIGTLSSLEVILENVRTQPSEAIKRKIYELVADLKNKLATPIIANFTLACGNIKIQTELISASWQSRLDFSEYLEPYINMTIEGDILLTHEILTLVEENCQATEETQVISSIGKIKDHLHTFSPEKKLLMVDLINILEEKKAAQ